MALEFRGPDPVRVNLRVNGRPVTVEVEPRRTLLSVLREDLGLTGAKRGCDEATCGACTVILDGRPVYSCMTLAIECEGREVRTIEGLAQGDRLHPVQQAFIEKDGYQCGFCNPGQVMSGVALLERTPHPKRVEVRAAMAGNVCRCGAYPNIVEAVLAAAEREGQSDADH